MEPSDADLLFRESHHKRKSDEMEREEDDWDAKNPRRPCPICGALFLEKDINNHLDSCLNRSAILELVRESDKEPSKGILKGNIGPTEKKRRR